jgi:hypothetical protein
MLMTIVLTCLVCGKISYTLITDRKFPPEYETIDSDIRNTAEFVAELSAISELPPVPESWDRLIASSQTYGYQVKPYSQADTEQIALYSGPLKNWSGVVRGETSVVLRAVRQLQIQVPIFLYDYKIEGDEIFINLSVVGT